MTKNIGNEHELPEEEEQEQVDRHQRAEHAALEHQHEDHELLAVRALMSPQAARMIDGVRKVVSRISQSEKPSTPSE